MYTIYVLHVFLYFQRNHDYLITEQADIVTSLLNTLDVTEAHLFAHDYGDTVALELLHRYSITKTYLRGYNFDPLKPHFYIVKLGFTEVYIIFLISAQKYRLWVLVRIPSVRQS